MLTNAQIKARANKITGSRIGIVMRQKPEELNRLWLEMTGQAEPEDLSDVWPVQLGTATETLNLYWYERKSRTEVTRRGEFIVHPFYDWAACTLDGWDDDRHCPVECKHCGGREPLEVIAERYQPQMQWQMEVTGAAQCALSVILGANEPRVTYLDRDTDYIVKALELAAAFMLCVQSKTPPAPVAAVPAPVKGTVVYDMTPLNSWAVCAADWLEHRPGFEICRNAEKALKALVPADASKCFGHGVRITRNAAGSLSLREDK